MICLDWRQNRVQFTWVIKMYVDYKEVGKRIAKRRKELGMKQFEVNEQAELSDKYLSNLERATSVPSVDVLMRLCDVLQTTPNALLLGTQAEHRDDWQKITDLMRGMTPKQLRLAHSLLKWIAAEELE